MKRSPFKWRKLCQKLAWDRAHGLCEVCGKNPDWRGLSGAHCVRRSRGVIASPNKAWNVLIACAVCHDHVRHGKVGLPLTQTEALALTAKLNKKWGIDPEFEG